MKQDFIKITNQLKTILDDTLFLNGRTKFWDNQMRLLGNIPELDSMAVITVISAIEANFCIFIEDDEIKAEIFASIDSLSNFINQKLRQDRLTTVK